MHIDQANAEDFDGLALLENVLFENSFGEGTLRRELEAGYCAVMRDGPAIVGYALVRPSAVLHDLMRLGVMPGFQGRGIGSWLLSHVLERFPGPMLLMVRKNNPRARALYTKNGFRITATSEEAWVMQRVTSPSL